MARSYDVLAMGRSSIDLYAHQIGVPMTEVTSFDAYVGGCPTNISVGTRRLGLRSALLTAVGDDQVGDFVLHFLDGEGVETRYVPRKAGHRTSAVVMSIIAARHISADLLPRGCADRRADDRRRAGGAGRATARSSSSPAPGSATSPAVARHSSRPRRSATRGTRSWSTSTTVRSMGDTRDFGPAVRPLLARRRSGGRHRGRGDRGGAAGREDLQTAIGRTLLGAGSPRWLSSAAGAARRFCRLGAQESA